MRMYLNAISVIMLLIICLSTSACGRISADVEMKDMIYSHLRGPYVKKYEDAGITRSLHDMQEKDMHELYKSLEMNMNEIKEMEKAFSKIRESATINTKLIDESNDNAKVEVEYTTYDFKKIMEEAEQNTENEIKATYGNMQYIPTNDADRQLRKIGRDIFVKNLIKALENSSPTLTNKTIINCNYSKEKELWIPNPEEYYKLHKSIIVGNKSSQSAMLDEKKDTASITDAQKIILGSWKDSQGDTFKVTNNSFGLASYEIKEVIQHNGRTIIRVNLNAGKSVGEITILDNDHNHMTYKNTTTGYVKEYTRQ